MSSKEIEKKLAASKGGRVVKFIENFCVHGDGDFYGQPFKLDLWQKQIIYNLYELNPNGERKYRESLLGVPKGNGKSALISAIGLYELLGNGTVSPLVTVAAASFEQADIVFGNMRTMCEQSPYLRNLTEVYQNSIGVKNGPGRIYRVAAKAGTADGGRNSAFIADEIHEWSTPNLQRVHYVLSNNTAKRQDSLILNITTAGYDLDTLCGRLYQRGKRKQSGESLDPDFYFYWLEPDETDDFEDPATWAKVNPAISGGWWPIDNLKRRRKALPLPEFQRYHLNMWTRTQEESWLPEGLWSELAEDFELDQSRPTYAGVDMALKHDSVAVVWGQRDPESGLIYLDSKIWRNDGFMFDYAEVETFISGLNKDFNMVEVAYDPAFFERSAQALYDLNVPMVEFPQTHGRMVPACGESFALISAKKVRHKNQATFNDQVLSAVNRPTERGFRLSKGKSKRKIDGAIAMVMCLDRLTFPTRPTEQPNIGIVEW